VKKTFQSPIRAVKQRLRALSGNSGFSAIEVMIALGIVGIAAAAASSAFMNGQRAIALVSAQLESGMLQQRMLDFLSDPQLCKATNIALDGLTFSDTHWDRFATLDSIRVGPSTSADIGEPVIAKKDYGSFAVEAIELYTQLPMFSLPSTVNNIRRAGAELVVTYRSKGAASTKQRSMTIFLGIDNTNHVVDCFLHSAEQRICEDLRWTFDSTAVKRCTPPAK
jgi:prepilin-type N-terminal cleavage/methylation domain-containing protein